MLQTVVQRLSCGDWENVMCRTGTAVPQQQKTRRLAGSVSSAGTALRNYIKDRIPPGAWSPRSWVTSSIFS